MAEAREIDLMMENAWHPFSRPVADNPLAVLDCTSIDADEDCCQILDGVPMTGGEPPVADHAQSHQPLATCARDATR
eukprot:COSAG02_NODE_2305_length_9181_cov_3.277001_2_plen_77_part_00